MKKITFPKVLNLFRLFRKKETSGESDDKSDDDVNDSSDAVAESGDMNSGDDDDVVVDDDGSSRAPRLMVIFIAGSLVLLVGISVGIGWYYFGDDKVAGVKRSSTGKASLTKKKGPMVSLVMPPKGRKVSGKGGLNQFLGAPSKLPKQGSEKGGLNQLLGAPSKLPKQGSEKGGLNQLLRAPSKGVITPSALGKTANGKTSSAKLRKSKDSFRSATNGNLAGRRALSSSASAVGIIGGRFGGRADPLGGAMNAIGGLAQAKGAGLVIPSVTSVTLKSLPDNPGGRPLGPTPVNTLIEKKEGLSGFLPKAGKGDDVSWKVYARPYNGEEKGRRVAVVVMGLGLSRASSMAAIKKLPPEISLALDPYAMNLSDWLVRARMVGHEVLLTLPMESEQFPVQDAGPYALKTSLNEQDNIKRLEEVLSRVTGYFGVATVLGSRFGDSKALMTVVLNNLKDRGLMLLTTGSQNSLLAPKIARKIELPLVVGDVTLDAEPSPAGVQAQLRRLESILKDKNVAVAVAHPYPTTLRRLIAWTKTLEGKKITLVPVSALINKQFTKEKQ